MLQYTGYILFLLRSHPHPYTHTYTHTHTNRTNSEIKWSFHSSFLVNLVSLSNHMRKRSFQPDTFNIISVTDQFLFTTKQERKDHLICQSSLKLFRYPVPLQNLMRKGPHYHILSLFADAAKLMYCPRKRNANLTLKLRWVRG